MMDRLPGSPWHDQSTTIEAVFLVVFLLSVVGVVLWGR